MVSVITSTISTYNYDAQYGSNRNNIQYDMLKSISQCIFLEISNSNLNGYGYGRGFLPVPFQTCIVGMLRTCPVGHTTIFLKSENNNTSHTMCVVTRSCLSLSISPLKSLINFTFASCTTNQIKKKFLSSFILR